MPTQGPPATLLMQSASAIGTTEQPRTLIDIGAQRLVAVVRRGASVDVRLELPLGARRIAEKFFRHDPPQPGELEAAIDAVEDQVMRLAGQLPKGSSLLATGSLAGDIQGAVNSNDHAKVKLDEVEQLFQRLASASLGSPTARRGLPSGNEFVAAVLILREFMHHFDFALVVLRPDAE